MDKKPGLLFSVYALALIVLASVFKLHLQTNSESAKAVTKSVADHLFVCPSASQTWDSVAKAFSFSEKYISMFVVFIIIVLVFSWGWALYQNLLKDKFSADAYKNPWYITKVVFWITIVCCVLVMTPNHFRAKVSVRSGGQVVEKVLCEQSAPDATSVKIRTVKQ